MAETQQSILELVAHEAGVSPRTVQRVLAGDTKEAWNSSARRAAEIRRIAERLRYRPNDAARAMSTGCFGAIALLLSTQPGRSYLPAELLLGINEALLTHDLNLSVTGLSDAQLTSADFVPRILRQAMADGLLIDYTDQIPQRMVDLIRKYRIPSIWFNSPQETDCVCPDDRGAARRAVTHLLEAGHRRIAYMDLGHMAGRELHFSAVERRTGYEEAMTAQGLASTVVQQQVLYRDRLAFVEPWLQRNPDITAVMTYGPDEATCVFTAAQGLGRRVPTHLSLLTFADHKVVAPGVVLSAMLVPQQNMGRRAVEMLLEKIAHPSRRLAPVAMPFGFEPGHTVAGPQAGRD